MGTVTGFVREFVKSPTTTAAVGPSSRQLARRMVEPVPIAGDPVIVELGPGTGAFTREIQRRLHGRGRHLAVELNERWARELGERFPAVESVCADAHVLPGLLADRDVRADVVVSGLPWAAHVERDGRSLVEVIAESMAPDGAFTQFAYTWTRWAAPARRLRTQVDEAFAEVEVSPTVWRNVPPAVAYVARRPR
ncbi:methyltransferase domain-containing protein [Allosaccharopolyspora coralli]|uniref:Methyltransferase domain-containing protein n=1 Tax=Allosaccharopolyspora coralli TaxID=2665642 RepID=A0A5Q3QGE5_9PSEU|nr:methyltransferase domain-containing protein [Allosaccharopolyspora coralli]QGK69887.1 methyltransferase domain-containing protein [Allosaccharopolyspora coralli]